MSRGFDEVLAAEGVDPSQVQYEQVPVPMPGDSKPYPTIPGEALERYADAHMFEAAPMEKVDDMIRPQVRLLWMTPDPLGAIAAACRMYEGKPTHSLSDITDGERKRYFGDMQKTHLLAPLEFVNLHFFIEGVSRSFTHQQVRQRTAVFAQESLRFAVKANMAEEVTVPPSVAELPKHHPTRQMIDNHNMATQYLYNYLVANGIPAEDAREYLPHAVSTRLNYHTNLRNLIDHAGNRLCTQAQLHWRDVFTQIKDAIRWYLPDFSYMPEEQRKRAKAAWEQAHDWQFKIIAESGMFKPACYQMGKCPFKASFDRGCTIRERVEIRAKNGGDDPSQWHKPFLYFDRESHDYMTVATSEGIRDEEWQLDRKAAFK